MEKVKQHYIAFLGGCLAVQIVLQFVLPYPFGLIIIIGIMVTMPYLGRKIFLKQMGGSEGNFGLGPAKLKMVCICCNLSTNRRICPRCGGNAFKAQ